MTLVGDLEKGEKEGVSSQISNSQMFFEPETFCLLAFKPYTQNFQRTNYPCSEMARVKGRRKRSQHRTKTGMDFDPILKAIHNQKEVEDYLVKYGVHLPSNVKVEWCPPNTNYTKSSRIGGVYLHP